MLPVIIGIVVVIVIACAIAGIYNNMVTKRNRIDNAWQNIDTQLQRRNDLIPNLVETVKGYAKHEQDTLAAVVNARNAAVSATTPEAKMEADNVLTGALRQLFAVAEAYPDLKANTNFTQLQASLEDTENKISYARQSYNDCVLSYNNAIQTFPAVIFAGIFQFKERQASRPPRPPARHRPSSSNQLATYPNSAICINRPRRMHTSTGRLLFARRYPQGRRANFGVFSIPEPTGQERTHRTALKTMILSPQRLRDRSFFYRMRLMAPDFRPKTSMQAPSTAENSQKCTPRPTPGERQPKKRARPLFGCNYGKALTANQNHP